MSDWLELEQVPLLRIVAVAPAAKATDVAPTCAILAQTGSTEDTAVRPSPDDTDATIVQPRLDLLIDNDWTLEPKQGPILATKPALPSMPAVVKLSSPPIAAPSQLPASNRLARPALVRPTSPKSEIAAPLSSQLPAPAAIQVDRTPTFARRAPQIKIKAETNSDHLGPSLASPRVESNCAPLIAKAPPKPRAASAPSAAATSESTRTPSHRLTAASAIASVSSSEVSRPVTPRTAAWNAVTDVRPVAKPSPDGTDRAYLPKPDGNKVVAPQIAPDTKPEPVLAAAVHPPAVTTGSPPEPVEPIGSLIPSVTSLYPDMPVWRKSHRSLFVAAGATVAATAIIFIALASAPKKSDNAHSVAARPAATASSEVQSVKATALPNLPEIANEPMPVAQRTNSSLVQTASVSSKPNKRIVASSTDISRSGDAIRPSRRQLRDGSASSEAPNPSRLTHQSQRRIVQFHHLWHLGIRGPPSTGRG